MIGCDEAQALLRALAGPLGEERLSIEDAAGRILAAPVAARFDAPSAPVSAMDGYAVRDADFDAAGARLPVAGESFAGRPFTEAAPAGSCVRIFTGAMVPDGFDRVVIQENVLREGDYAVFDQRPGGGRNIRAAGSDFRAGETILPAGVRLTPQALVAAAGADASAIEVQRRPDIAILATGDELTAPGEAKSIPGGVPDSVSLGVAAMCARYGGRVIARRRLKDDPPALETAAREALARADVVVVTGGASVGERDYARTMFGSGLDMIFPKVAIKPGKPVWAARADARIVIGLPGNPGSALVTARLFLAPLIAGLAGAGFDSALEWREAALSEPLPAGGPRETFLRGRFDAARVTLAGNQESGAQAVLGRSDALIRRPADAAPAPAGASAPVLDL